MGGVKPCEALKKKINIASSKIKGIKCAWKEKARRLF
jgi:hypothetical protein